MDPRDDIAHRWRIIIALLGEAISGDIYVQMRSRYAKNDEELEPVREQAKKAWAAAKHLYCEKKDQIDRFYESEDGIATQTVDGKSSFEAMREVINREMQEEIEKQLLDSETKI